MPWTGELIQLRMDHISFIQDDILSLPSTKTSKRSGNGSCRKPFSQHSTAASGGRPGGLLLSNGAAHFRRILRALCQAFFDLDCHVTPYSLRRGGHHICVPPERRHGEAFAGRMGKLLVCTSLSSGRGRNCAFPATVASTARLSICCSRFSACRARLGSQEFYSFLSVSPSVRLCLEWTLI